MNQFQQAYQGHPPWDVGHAQRALVDIAPRIQGSILDLGCGTGDNAIFFAQLGHAVYGIDFVEEAVEQAKAKAADRQVSACFLVMDALSITSLPLVFDNAIDSGLFHVFSDEDRASYVQSLAAVLRPGGHLWLLCFSDSEPPGAGPRRISRAELQEAFKQGWEILEIEPTQFETSPHVQPGTFTDGGPRAYLAVIKRQG